MKLELTMEEAYSLFNKLELTKEEECSLFNELEKRSRSDERLLR